MGFEDGTRGGGWMKEGKGRSEWSGVEWEKE